MNIYKIKEYRFEEQVDKHLETLKISELNEDKHCGLSPIQTAISRLTPAEHLALAYQFKHTAERYGYKYFWDRAYDITDEEEIDCFNPDTGELDQDKMKVLEDRVQANHIRLLAETNTEAKELLKKFDWHLTDDVNLWEELTFKPEW